MGIPGGERGNVQTGGGGIGWVHKPTRLQYIHGISHGPFRWRRSQSDGLYWYTLRNFTAYLLSLSVFLFYFKQNMKNRNRINVNLTLLLSGLQTYIFLLSEIIIYKLHIFVSCYINNSTRCGGAVGWGTALQARRLPVSMKFLIDIILPAALWPWGWLSL